MLSKAFVRDASGSGQEDCSGDIALGAMFAVLEKEYKERREDETRIKSLVTKR